MAGEADGVCCAKPGKDVEDTVMGEIDDDEPCPAGHGLDQVGGICHEQHRYPGVTAGDLDP
jgi:hypothetical protein